MRDGMVHNVYYRDVSGVVAAGVEGLLFWFLYVKEDAPSTMPNCPRYTDFDAQATIDKYRHLAVGPGYTFGDLWEARVRAAMVPLEEGVVKGPWNNGGRVVLMGDCVAKVSLLHPSHRFLWFSCLPLVDGQSWPWWEHSFGGSMSFCQRARACSPTVSRCHHATVDASV